MKIRPEIEVFPDKEHCESQVDKVCCDFLITRDKKTFCSVYHEYLEGCDLKKCDGCKVDYQIAEKKEQSDYDEFVNTCANECKCCRGCFQDVPCAGVMAGGPCDQMCDCEE